MLPFLTKISKSKKFLVYTIILFIIAGIIGYTAWYLIPKYNQLEPKTKTNASPPKELVENYNVTVTTADNKKPIYTISPKGGAKSQKVIFYIHGGAYSKGFYLRHWSFFGEIIDSMSCTIIAPDYPLTPKYDYKDVFAMIEPLYDNILEDTSPDHVILMGDSAGGGISLALCETLALLNKPHPSKTILLSPWLDSSMTNPDIDKVQPFDKNLKKDSLLKDATHYADGAKNLKFYKVSPIYGSYDKLKNITLFTGTYDILYPDAKKFNQLALTSGLNIDYREYQGMPHDWMLARFDANYPDRIKKSYSNWEGIMDESVLTFEAIMTVLKENNNN